MFLSNLVTLLKVAKKKLTLDAATEAFQFFSDCNETESVIKEFITLAKSKVILWICVKLISTIIQFLRISVKTS